MTTPPEWHELPENPYNAHAWLVGEPLIGPGCWIGAFTVIDGSGGLEIGAGCDVSAGAQIYSHSTVRRALNAGAAPVERAATKLGDQVHVGAGAVILMGCEIGDRVVIGAGAVVPQFTVIPDDALAVGVPARIIPGGASRYQGDDRA